MRPAGRMQQSVGLIPAAEPVTRVALITGITGQDGSYLTELLLEKGYAVHGVLRRASTFTTGRIEHIFASKGGTASAPALIQC